MPRDKLDGAASAAPNFERMISPLVWLAGAASALLILVTLVLTVYSVGMRYFLSRPPDWIDELTGYLLVALVMAGAAEAYRRGNHIAIDLLTERLSGLPRLIASVWADLCVLAFAAVLGVSTWNSIEFARMFGSYSPGAMQIETWIPQVPMLIAAVLLAIMAVARLAGHFMSPLAR